MKDRKKTLSFMLDGRYDFEKEIEKFETQILELEEFLLETELGVPEAEMQLSRLRKEAEKLKREIYSKLTPWQKVLVARHPFRPTFADYIEMMFDDFVELHGDRRFGDDKAIICGFATISDDEGSHKVMIVGHEKGRALNERMERHFGSAHPEGYRKALAKMELAARFALPILTFIDTPGAFPGIGAEERGQAFAIAENLMAMSRFEVPIVSTVIGEGGSGGALGIGVCDRLLMLEYSYYSVISPEGCAAILWRGEEKEHLEDAAKILRLTAQDLYEFGIVDEVVKEPLGGAHRDHQTAAKLLKTALLAHLRQLLKIPKDKLLTNRYEKYRKIGRFLSNGVRSGVKDA